MAHGAILGQTPTIDTSTLVTQDSLTNTLNNYVTTSALNNKLSSYVTTSALNSRLNNYATTASLNNYLLRSGGTMTGRLNMGNNKITNLANGTANTDAATVGQLNAAVANNVAAVFGMNDENKGVVIGPTCLYVWKASTLVSTRIPFDSKYAIINKWYNLSGLYNKGINELDLLAPNGTNTTKIGRVYISDSSFSVYISTTYCGFAYFQTFYYN